MTEGEGWTDNEKSGSIWPSAAVWMPSPLPYDQKLVATFPEAPSAATIGPSSRSHLGNVGLYIDWYKEWGQGEEITSEHGTL